MSLFSNSTFSLDIHFVKHFVFLFRVTHLIIKFAELTSVL